LADAPASAQAPAVLVTRPEREAALWAQALGQRGIRAHALPLIAIQPAADPAALLARRADLAAYSAAMFVSANAAHGFLEGMGVAWPAGTRAWATGPGTARALEASGVPAAQVDAPGPQAAQFDSEALWALVGVGLAPGDRVLIVRGGDASGQAAGRDWLASQLEAAGVRVDTVVAYLRGLPRWSAAQHARARAGAGDGAWWLFSSSEGVDNLRQMVPGQAWDQARALCTHPRIAEAARHAGFGTVMSSRPGLDDVAAFLQSSA
jgi:uroporphyrinogen-III synthase